VHPDDHSPVNQVRGDLSEVTLPPGRTDDMFSRLFYADIPSRLGWAVSRRWYQLRAYWYAWDKEPWVFALVLGLIATAFFFGLRAANEHQDHRRSLACLARNVYFEARGEPVAGQYAVAEVTMNRRASGRYSNTVCGVVYQKNWDPIRKHPRFAKLVVQLPTHP